MAICSRLSPALMVEVDDGTTGERRHRAEGAVSTPKWVGSGIFSAASPSPGQKATSCASSARAAPPSIASPAMATPSVHRVVLPATISAAAALRRTASR